MSHAEIILEYLLKKNPDATIKDWIIAMQEIERDKIKKFCNLSMLK